MKRSVSYHYFLKSALGAALLASLTACTGSSSSLSINSVGGGGAAAIGSITMTSFKQVLGSGYAVVGYSAQNQNLNVSSGDSVSTTSSSDMKISGTCERGVNTITVKAKKTAGTGSGVTSHDLTVGLQCAAGVFEWTPSVAIETPFAVVGEGTWEITLVPVDETGTEKADLAVKLNVSVDSTAPAAASAPTIDGNACPGAVWSSCGGTYVAQTTNPSVNITVPVDTQAILVTGGDASLDSPNFTDGHAVYETSLSVGSMSTYTFRTYDALGNTSGSLAVSLSYTAPLAGGSEDFQFTGVSVGSAVVTSGSYKLVNAGNDAVNSATLTSGSYALRVGKIPLLKEIQ